MGEKLEAKAAIYAGDGPQVCHSGRTQAVELARKAFDTGRFSDGIRICDHLLQQNPQDAEVAMLRFDFHVRAGEFDEAQALICRFIQPRAATDVLLRAAFATAYTGRSRLDMKEFCDGFLPWSLAPRSSPFLGSRSLRAFRLSASLAVGTDARMSGQNRIAEMYLTLTLKEDPAEPIVALLLEGIYSERRDFGRALDALIHGRNRMSGADARDADLRIRELQRIVNAVPIAAPKLRTQFRVA